MCVSTARPADGVESSLPAEVERLLWSLTLGQMVPLQHGRSLFYSHSLDRGLPPHRPDGPFNLHTYGQSFCFTFSHTANVCPHPAAQSHLNTPNITQIYQTQQLLSSFQTHVLFLRGFLLCWLLFLTCSLTHVWRAFRGNNSPSSSSSSSH